MADDLLTQNFCVRGGNTGVTNNENGIVFQIADADLYTFHFKTGAYTGGPIAKTSPADITVELSTVTGEKDRVIVPLSLAEVQSIVDAGQAVAYELERRTLTTQRTIIAGSLTPVEGLTDD